MVSGQGFQASGTVNGQVPDHFWVNSDNMQAINCSGGNAGMRRQINYFIKDANNN
jgi:hypothetical protein